MEYLIALFYSIGCAVLCGNIARQKGYSAAKWIVAGFLFNIISLIAIGFYRDIPKDDGKAFTFSDLRRVMDKTT